MIKNMKIPNILKNAGIYTMSSILSALVPFFCMPILTRYLTPEDYGVTAMMASIISFLTPLVGINVHGAIAANYYNKELDFNRYVKNCLSILLISTFIISMVVFVFEANIERMTFFPAEWLWSVTFICFVQFLFQVTLTMLQMQNKAITYGIAQIMNVVLNTSITLYLVVMIGMNWEGRALAQIVTAGLLAVYCIYFLYTNRMLSLNFDVLYVKDALNFGIPLIPHALSGYLLTIMDRFYISNYVDLATAGLFMLGSQIGGGIGIIATAFNNAYVPWLFEKLSKITDEFKIKIVKYTYIYFICALIIAIIYSAVMPYVLSVFLGEKFQNVSYYVIPFSLAGALNGMYYMVVAYIFYVKRTKELMFRTFGVSIIHTVMSYYSISNFGVIGACICVVLSYLLMFLVVWQFSKKVYQMPWNIKKAFFSDRKI